MRLIKNLHLPLLALMLMLQGCQQFNHPAEKVVYEMYDAISEGDIDAYMDSIHPDNRKRPNLFGLVTAFSVALGPVRADLGKLTHISTRDVEVSMIREHSNYAIVQAEGYLRYPILMLEFNFCDQHDVRLHSDGNWYVDLYAPERIQRLEILYAEFQSELMTQAESSSDATVDDLYFLLFQGIERGLNLCIENP